MDSFIQISLKLKDEVFFFFFLKDVLKTMKLRKLSCPNQEDASQLLYDTQTQEHDTDAIWTSQ
jgi:hypothetical protein